MNGYIQAQIISEGGDIDELGQPIFDTEESWADLVKCSYIPNEYQNKGTYSNDGEFTQMSFEITTSDMSFKADILRLYDEDKNIICEEKVKSLFALKRVQRIKIKI